MKKTSQRKPISFIDLYCQFIKDSISGKRLQPNGKKVSPGTIKCYKSTLLLLQKFSNSKNFILRIYQVKYLTQRELTIERNYWNKFYKKFTDYLYKDCNHYDNYAGHNIKNIRTCCGYLNKGLMLGVGDFYKQLYVRKEEVPIVTLLPEELNFLIYNIDFETKINANLKIIKDVFIFGCTVALRFSDLMALKKNNLRIINDDWYLVTQSKKTRTNAQIKLPEYAISILKKYKNENGRFILPRITLSTLNKYLKELNEAAGFTHDVSKTRERRGVIKEIHLVNNKKKKVYRFCDLVTTHTMRRTAITTMLCLGMPEHVIRKISGHSPMSKEFYRYVALAQSYQDNETSQMFERLKEKKLLIA